MTMTKAEKNRMDELEQKLAEYEEMGIESLQSELAGANKLIGEQIAKLEEAEQEIDRLTVAVSSAQDALQNLIITDKDGTTLDYEISDGCAVIEMPEVEREGSITRNDLRLAMAPQLRIPHAHADAQQLEKAIDEILKIWK